MYVLSCLLFYFSVRFCSFPPSLNFYVVISFFYFIIFYTLYDEALVSFVYYSGPPPLSSLFSLSLFFSFVFSLYFFIGVHFSSNLEELIKLTQQKNYIYIYYTIIIIGTWNNTKYRRKLIEITRGNVSIFRCWDWDKESDKLKISWSIDRVVLNRFLIYFNVTMSLGVDLSRLDFVLFVLLLIEFLPI